MKMSDNSPTENNANSTSSASSLRIKEKKEDQLEKKYRRWLQFDIILVVVLMIITWGLLTLPIIFYYHPIPVEGVARDGNGTSMLMDGNLSSIMDGNNSGADVPLLNCREDFFRDPLFNNACVPICPDWQQGSDADTISIDVVVFLSYSIGFIMAIIIIVISVFRRKTMFAFPNSLVVYMSIIYIVQNFFYIVTYFDRGGLYCTSRNVFFTFTNVAPYCVISGMVQVYSTLSLALWWFMLAAALSWKIWFPIKAKMFEKNGRDKLIHISCALAGFLIPFIPIIAHMATFAKTANSDPNLSFLSGGLGFAFVRYPPLPCNGLNVEVVFYTNIFPADIILTAGITLILLMLLRVHRHHILYKAANQKNPFSFGIAERKLFIVFIHYVIQAAINLTAFTDLINRLDLFRTEFTNYLMCELPGHDPLNPCDRSKFERYSLSTALIIFSFAFHGTLPVGNLIFTISVVHMKKQCKIFCSKIKSISSSSTKSSSVPVTQEHL